MSESYTEFLERRCTELAYEAGSLRGLLDIALIDMKLSGDPYTESEYKWIKGKLDEMDKEKK